MMAAMVLKSPELALEKQEADALAQAISEVERHYSIALSPETRAWLGLAGCAAMIYGPRAYMINKRRKEAKRGNATPAVRPPVVVSQTATAPDDAPAQTGGLSASDFGL